MKAAHSSPPDSNIKISVGRGILRKNNEVVFVVKGFLNDPEGNIGKTKCNGLYKIGNKFHLRNGRISYYIEDQDFHNAYMTAKKRLKKENFGDLTVETTFLFYAHLN